MSPHSRTVAISGRSVRGEVQLLGAMAGPFSFDLGGRMVQPFAVAPWADDPAERLADLPPLLRRLRGEWPCVPFGGVNSPPGLPPDWDVVRAPTPEWHRDDHGFAAHHPWTVDAQSETAVTLSIRYPEDHPVERLERGIACHPSEPHLDFSLMVVPRRDITMPLGLHPVFRLPEAAGTAVLDLSAETRLWSFPVDVEPGKSAALPDQRGVPVSDLLGAAGRLDITSLPLADDSEDLLVAAQTGGRISLRNDPQNYEVSLRWDSADLPLCSLWLSNRGRSFYPWNGRFTAICIEPVAAPFDLGPAFAGGSPLTRAGLRTGVELRAGQPWSTEYSISVARLA